MNQVKRIEELLEQLGGTANEVAAALKAKGVQGVRNSVRFLNPIVKYVQGEVGDDSLQVDVIAVHSLHVKYPDGSQGETPLRPAIREFLDNFNRGAYPELELPAQN